MELGEATFLQSWLEQIQTVPMCSNGPVLESSKTPVLFYKQAMGEDLYSEVQYSLAALVFLHF